MVGQQNAMSDTRYLITDNVGDGLYRITAKICDIVDRLSSRLFEHKFQFALLIRRIDCNEYHTGEATG